MCSTFSKEADTFILIFGYSTFNLFPAQCTDSWSIGLLGSVHSFTVIYENGDFSPSSKKKYVVHSNRFSASTLKRWNDVYTITSFTEHVPPTTLTTWRFQKSLLWGTFSKAYVFGARKRRLRVDGRLKRSKKSPCSNKNGYEWIFFFARGCAENDSNTLHVDTLSPDMCGRDLIISYLTNESG